MGWLWILLGLAGIGAVVIVYGLGNPESGIGKLVYRYWPFPQPEWARQRVADREAVSLERLHAAAAEPDIETKLRQADVGGFMTDIMGRNIQFVGKMLLLELQFFDGDKDNKVHVDPHTGRKLREFQAYLLSGNRMLLEQPEGEGMELRWFLYENVTGKARGFTEYLKGSNDSPGPGMLFAKSKQTAEVVAELLGDSWLLQDILWADFEIQDGKTPVRNDTDGMARAAILLGRIITGGSEGAYELGDEWILSVDLRVGGGSDTLWWGKQFDPAVDIQDI